jgi:hypothetical protein
MYSDQELIKAFYPRYKEGLKGYLAVFGDNYIKPVWANSKTEATMIAAEYGVRIIDTKLRSIHRNEALDWLDDNVEVI